jgi:hypothetical protein
MWVGGGVIVAAGLSVAMRRPMGDAHSQGETNLRV